MIYNCIEWQTYIYIYKLYEVCVCLCMNNKFRKMQKYISHLQLCVKYIGNGCYATRSANSMWKFEANI